MDIHGWASRLRNSRSPWLMFHDGAAIMLGYWVFATLRYEEIVAGHLAVAVLAFAVSAVIFQIAAGSIMRIYQGRATVASLEETLLLGAVVMAGAAYHSVVNVVTEPQPISRAVPLGAAFMALSLMLLSRGLWRSYSRSLGMQVPEDGESTLIYGAGDAGRQLVRSMLETPEAAMRPVGFVDDDRWKRNLRVDGVRVLGTRDDIAAVARSTGATRLVLAIPSASPALIRDASTIAREAGLEIKVLPSVGELLSSRVSVTDVRDIDVHDLLGRAAIETDVAAIAGYLTGKRVLVTGAGGSIGSELCRQIVKYGPSEMIMLDRDESALHSVQLSIEGRALLDSKDVVLADIRDQDALNAVFSDRRPEVVFHAAALKHLPMLQQYPIEAMKTNVLGTVNVLRASAAVGVERFVNISTDKAADPSSVLGYSKRVAERLTASIASDTAGCYLSVRFGNVLGSRGSVLTSFAAQISAGGPVTVTHPEVTRYFMTVQEAVQLVIQAAAIGDDGEALILDMGEPVRIEDVARQLIDQSHEDIEVVYTGLRPGEKLHEHLFAEGETGERRVHPLVSHVGVPELRLSRVTSAPLNIHPHDMHKQLRTWCDTAEEAGYVQTIEVGPREWRSIEN